VVAQPRFSLNQVLEVAEEGSGKTILVPWHPELVVRIDRRAGIVVIDPPAGLRELNR
jgi:ribosomal 30S subunit maturation factor RimM